MGRYIITGATGTIGIALIEKLTKDNEVTCIVNPNSKRLENLLAYKNVNVVKAGLSEYKNLKLNKNYDVMIHLAWENAGHNGRDNIEVQKNNIGYTIDAIKLAYDAGCTAFIGAGSQAEFGVVDDMLTIDHIERPLSGYGIAKLSAGKLGAIYAKQLGIRFNWVRILSIYGTGDGKGSFVSYIIRELSDGNCPKLTRCEQIWDYLNNKDAAEALLAVVNKGVDGKSYVLGSGKGRMLKAYVEDIKEVMGTELYPEFGAVDYYPHQPMYMVADISELTNDTGWCPKVDFKEGIREILRRENSNDKLF